MQAARSLNRQLQPATSAIEPLLLHHYQGHHHDALGSFSQQGFELDKELLDGVQVGRVFRQEEELGTGRSDGVPDGFAFVASQVVHDDDVAAAQGRQQDLDDIGKEALAVDRAVEDARRGDLVMAQGGEEGEVRQRPCGTLASSRWPLGQRPWRRVMLVLAQVSSMKTRRVGSSLA